MSKRQRTWYFAVALLLNFITFFINTESAYIYFCLLIINAFIFFEMVFFIGEKAIKIARIEPDFLMANILGFSLFSVLIFITINIIPFPKIIYILILTSFCILKIFEKQSQCKTFGQQLLIEFKEHGTLHFSLILIYFVLSLIPNNYHDPLNYHLLGPYIWSNDHSPASLNKFLQIINCGYFEYLYLAPFSFFKNSFLTKIFSQVFCQLIHFFYGGIISAFLIVKILNKLGLKNKKLVFLTLLLIFTRISLGNLIVTAKTDWAIISIGLMLLYSYFFKNIELTLTNSSLFGFLLGYTICLKYPYVFLAIPFVILVLLEKRITFRNLIALGIVSIITISPLLLRNFYWTNNPFSPLMTNLFNTGYIGPTWTRAFSQFGNLHQLDWQWIVNFVSRITARNYLNYFIFITPIFLIKHREKKVFYLWLISILSLIMLFLLTPIEITETRHIATSIVILMILNCFIIMNNINLIKNKLLQISCITVFIILVVGPYSKSLPQHDIIQARYKDILHLGYEKYVEQELGHSILPFLRKNSNSMIVFAASDIPMYYFIDFNVIKIWDWSDLDKELYLTKNFNELIDVFSNFKATHLLIDNYYFDRFYNPVINDKIMETTSNFKQTITYKQKETFLIDINLLKNEI